MFIDAQRLHILTFLPLLTPNENKLQYKVFSVINHTILFYESLRCYTIYMGKGILSSQTPLGERAFPSLSKLFNLSFRS